MGEIIELDKTKVRVLQRAVENKKIRNFLLSHLSSDFDPLVPVRKIEDYYYLLDGHSRGSITTSLSQWKETPLYGYVAESKNDFIEKIPENFPQNSKSELNYFIKDNFYYPSSCGFEVSLEEFVKNINSVSTPEKLLTNYLSFYEFMDFEKGPKKNLLRNLDPFERAFKGLEIKPQYSKYKPKFKLFQDTQEC